MPKAKAEGEPRVGGGPLTALAVTATAVVVVGAWWLVDVAGLFETVSTVTTSTSQGQTSTTRVESNGFATAQWTTVVLAVVGALLLVGGFVLALAELTKITEVTAESEDGGVAIALVDPGGIVTSLAELAKAIGTALKDAKASTALIVAGMVLLVFAGAVAWNTTPQLPAPTSTSEQP
ncbi:MAG: hypothetical protein GX610_03040 [Rhodococcus sp.]|nr:hypothetical protein [Rhodococcus sp. (in: high G+C Gram-positive bacteria)]